MSFFLLKNYKNKFTRKKKNIYIYIFKLTFPIQVLILTQYQIKTHLQFDSQTHKREIEQFQALATGDIAALCWRRWPLPPCFSHTTTKFNNCPTLQKPARKWHSYLPNPDCFSIKITIHERRILIWHQHIWHFVNAIPS